MATAKYLIVKLMKHGELDLSSDEPVTRDDAIKSATTRLSVPNPIEKIFVCEIVEQIEREKPPISIKPFTGLEKIVGEAEEVDLDDDEPLDDVGGPRKAPLPRKRGSF